MHNEGTILIVDDEEMIRDLLTDMLAESGNYRILTSVNGKEALELIHQTEVDLVLTDLRMPVMGGMELLAELRKTKPDIPVVILTGYGRREDAIEALRLGASNFLMKPQEVEMIHTIASKILRMRTKKKLEQRIFDYFEEEKQIYHIPSDPKFTLPLIELITYKVSKIGICDQFELMNLRLALDEALTNAIVHGNLNIKSHSKGATLEDLVEFNKMVSYKIQEESYRSRKVKILSHIKRDLAYYEVEDEGEGFDWRSLPTTLDESEMLANHGRGLILIRSFMTHVSFNEKGNCIKLTKKRNNLS